MVENENERLIGDVGGKCDHFGDRSQGRGCLLDADDWRWQRVVLLYNSPITQ